MSKVKDLSEEIRLQAEKHHNILKKINSRLDNYEEEERRLAYLVDHLNDKMIIKNENKKTRERIHELSKMTIAKNIIGFGLIVIVVILFFIIMELGNLREDLYKQRFDQLTIEQSDGNKRLT